MTVTLPEFDSDCAVSDLCTVGDLVRYGVTHFEAAHLVYGHGTTSAFEEAAFMTLAALNLPIDDVETFWDNRLLSTERKQLLDLFAARIKTRKPAPYILNRAYIQGIPFYVDDRVIVPRSFIGELMFGDELYNHLPFADDVGAVESVLDLCTGSGCLAILAAHVFPLAQVDAVDLSPDALAVARTNVDNHDVADRVTLHQGDLFAPIGDKKYDLILTNPPYVEDDALVDLPPEYAAEPELALAGGGAGGMDIVKRILATAAQHLTPSGILICEIGQGRPEIEEAFPDIPFIWLDTELSSGEVFLIRRVDLIPD